MKRIFGIALVLVMLFCDGALAVELTDVHGMPTQDVVDSLSVCWQDKEKTAYDLQVMPSDQLTTDQALDAYTFVYEQDNYSVRWYPDDTQQAIEKMIGSVDPDALYLTEMMRMHMAQSEPTADLDAVMDLKVDYQPGQLTVVVLGDTSNPDEIVWTPLESRVTAVGRLEYIIPHELASKLQGQDVLFSLLTIRTGEREVAVEEVVQESETIPSKQAGDNTRIVRRTDAQGNALKEPFDLIIVPESKQITRELTLLSGYLKEKKLPALDWLPEEKQNEARFLVGDKAEQLVIADYVPLITRNYRHTDGSAIAKFAFATPYHEGQTVVAALGLPKADAEDDGDTQMVWAVQQATVRADGTVDIVFDQLALIGMDTETGLLLVYGEPIAE